MSGQVVFKSSGVARLSVIVGPQYNCKFTVPASCLGIFVKDLVHSVSMVKYNYSHYRIAGKFGGGKVWRIW